MPFPDFLTGQPLPAPAPSGTAPQNATQGARRAILTPEQIETLQDLYQRARATGDGEAQDALRAAMGGEA